MCSAFDIFIFFSCIPACKKNNRAVLKPIKSFCNDYKNPPRSQFNLKFFSFRCVPTYCKVIVGLSIYPTRKQWVWTRQTDTWGWGKELQVVVLGQLEFNGFKSGLTFGWWQKNSPTSFLSDTQ